MFRLIWMMIVFLGVWLLASILNGLLFCITLFLLPTAIDTSFIAISMLISLVVLGPIHVVAGFITFVAKEITKNEFKTFQVTLFVMLCSSIAAAVLIINMDKQLGDTKYIVGLSVIISCITSTLFFRQSIKSNA